MEILTTNPYCKGVALMNGKLFWNPDLKLAQKIIDSGYGSVNEFRFFHGKIKWNNHLWANIQERNLYTVLMTRQNDSSSSSFLAKQIWAYHKEGNKESLWYQLIEHCWRTNSKDVESWMQIYGLLNHHQAAIKEEIHQMMKEHDAKIA